MKIQCEQCKIEYTIDDASIGERGIRAQCPRCAHITTIRKPAPNLDDARAKLEVARCVNCGKPCDPAPGDPIPVCANCQALGGEFGAKTTVGGKTPPPVTSGKGFPNPLAGLPGFNSPTGPLPGFGFGPPPAMAPAFGPTDPDIGAFNPTNSTMRSPPPSGATTGGIPAPPSYLPPADDGRSWKIKKSPSGEIYGPFDRELITGWIDSDKIVPADEICRVGGPWNAAADHEDFKELFAARYKLQPPPKASAPAPAYVAPPAFVPAPNPDAAFVPPAGAGAGDSHSDSGPVEAGGTGTKAGDVRTARGGAMAMTAERLGPRPGKRSFEIPRGAIFSVIGVLVLGAAVVAVVSSGIGSKVSLGLSSTPAPSQDDGVDKQIAAFAHDFAGATGSAHDHLVAGQTAMAADTVSGWHTARKEFAQSLALQKSNLEALAGIAEVDALLGQYDDQTPYLKESIELSGRAVERAPNVPRANRAKAAALLASRSPANYTDARNLLVSQVLVTSSADAIATAMLGASWRGANDARAEELLLKAAGMNKDLIRPKLELGLLYESQNRFPKALETFKQISNRSYLAGYHAGNIQEKVGKYREAAAAYDAAAKVALADGGGRSWAEAVLASAVIQYQALDHFKEASQQLAPLEAKLVAGDLKLKPALEGKIRLHLAIVNRLLGGAENLEKSLRYSTDVENLHVLELAPPAHFNAGLAKLRKSDFDGADRDLEEADAAGLTARTKSEIYFWQGQLKQRRGDTGAAGGKYEDSFHEDSQNWRAVVAQASMMVGAADQEIAGLDKMQELAHLDPDFDDGYQRVTNFFPDPSSDLLTKADRAFEKIHASHDTDPRASSARGIVAYFQKNTAKAKSHLQNALSESNPDAAGIVYSGLLLEQKGDAKAALEKFTQVKTSAPSAFLSMVIGRCLLKLGKLDEAQASLTESLQRSPYYPPAQYWMGVELSRHGDKKAAIAKWNEALRYDPNYLRVSQAIAEQDG